MTRERPPGTAAERAMIEETARHLGHLDAVRELIDGTTSY